MEDIVSKEVIKVDDVGMRFNLMEKKVDNLKEYFIKLLKREIRYQEFWALKSISFKVNKGDRLGILGLNGAGKSTLLKIIAGVLKPSEGELDIRGKIVPLLELGAGFDSQYTGMENIYLYGAVLGYPREFINEKFNEIVEFSELGDFINVPVKNYSSGMKARLGFSIATIMDPEILILDEVLSVGDAKFRKKSEKRILDMFEKGVTVLFVSHSIEQIRRICSRAIILDKGILVADGPVEEICNLYDEKYVGVEKAAKAKKKKKKKKKKPPVEVLEENTELVVTDKGEVNKELVPGEGIVAAQEIENNVALTQETTKK
jgi:ABC-2 type transport system ATP-binding protein